MPCFAPKSRYGNRPFSPKCEGFDGPLHLQCAWCRQRGRSQYFDEKGFPGAAKLDGTRDRPQKWTDRYNYNTLEDIAPNADRRAEVRTLLPQLKVGFATLVAGTGVTPRIMMYMSQLLDREIGLLTDEKGDGNLYLTLGAPTGVSRPEPKQRYRFLAHTHPTISNVKSQITQDMANASDAVEIVITMTGLILFYRDGKCYNPLRETSHYGPMEEELIRLDTPLNAKLFQDVTAKLNPSKPKLPLNIANNNDDDDWLFEMLSGK